jgi:hypothetical protein
MSLTNKLNTSKGSQLLNQSSINTKSTAPLKQVTGPPSLPPSPEGRDAQSRLPQHYSMVAGVVMRAYLPLKSLILNPSLKFQHRRQDLLRV